MQNETISVFNTESGQTMNVLVFDKRANEITVVIGEGIHSMKCLLIPTKNKQAYVGSILGREIIYHCSREQVQDELDGINPNLKKSRKFK